MIVKTSFKGNDVKCDCCNKIFDDVTMRKYEIGAFKTFCLCKKCEKQLANISNVDTSKKVLSVDDNIYY